MGLPTSKKTNSGLGRAIINKRVKDATRNPQESSRYTTDIARDNAAKLQSVTQEKDLDAFLNTAQLAAKDFTAEKQNVKIVHTPTVGPSVNQNPFLLSSEEEKDALRKHWEYRTQLRVPRRPPWTKTMTPAQLDRQEKDSILGWRRNLAVLQEKENLLLTPFERNLEVWRQLWRVVERSHLIVQIVDARNPLRFRCADLDDYVRDVEGPEGEKGTGAGLRKSLLLINKSDLLDQEQRRQWADYFDSQDIQYAFFSALDAKILQEARLATLEAGSVAAPPAEVVQDVRNKDAFTTSSDGLEDDKLVREVETLNVSQGPEEGSESSDAVDDPDSEDVETSDSADDESEMDHPSGYIPVLRDENEDPRTRVLSVLELEDLFLRYAPEKSAFTDSKGNLPPKTVVGLVGYPNVGKSSTINALLGEKKVSVSSTPGKTKHFQTIHLSSSIMLCDCPGLVFPQFATTKAELICDGVLPIDQMREYSAPCALVVQRVPPEILEATYGLSIRRRTVDDGGNGHQITESDFLSAYAIARGFARSGVGNPDEARAARYVLKGYVNGKLLYCHPPPSVPSELFNSQSHSRILQRLIDSGKKRAPTTRVGRNADTYIAPSTSSPAPGTSQSSIAQSAEARALDERFFDNRTMSSRPFVQGTSRSGLSISRNRMYPHQNYVANDGTMLSGREAHVAAILQAAGQDAARNKKHHKPRRVKLRKLQATTGYD